MSLREQLRIALRYTLAFGQGHLSVFMSLLSIAGLVLGTAVLLVVLSVMNGFDREMRERILALVPHLTVHTQPSAEDAREQLIQAYQKTIDSPNLARWINHTLHRLSYERELLGEVPRFEGEITPTVLQMFASSSRTYI